MTSGVEWINEYLAHNDGRPLSIASREAQLFGSYLSAMRALQAMTNAFGELGDIDMKSDEALAMAYAEIEKYLKHYAPEVAK